MFVNAYALSGTILTVRSEIIFVFNQAFARDRPNNVATTIITNAIPNAICINTLLSPRGLYFQRTAMTPIRSAVVALVNLTIGSHADTDLTPSGWR
jgi:hypothetical protein